MAPPVTSGLAFHLDASSPAMDGFVDAAPVGSWIDISGNNRHFVQNTPALQPEFRTNVFGARPALYFDGGDRSLTGPTTATPIPNYTFFAVVKPTTTTIGNTDQLNFGFTIAATTSGYGLWASLISQEVRQWAHAASSTASQTSSGAAIVNDEPVVVSFGSEQSGSGFVWRDGGLVLTQAAGSSLPAGSICIGDLRNARGINFAGYMGEIVVYSRLLSEAERESVESYLTRKWIAKLGVYLSTGNQAKVYLSDNRIWGISIPPLTLGTLNAARVTVGDPAAFGDVGDTLVLEFSDPVTYTSGIGGFEMFPVGDLAIPGDAPALSVSISGTKITVEVVQQFTQIRNLTGGVSVGGIKPTSGFTLESAGPVDPTAVVWSENFEDADLVLTGDTGNFTRIFDSAGAHSGDYFMQCIVGTWSYLLDTTRNATPGDDFLLTGWFKVASGTNLAGLVVAGYQIHIDGRNGTGSSAGFHIRDGQSVSEVASDDALAIVPGAWYRIEVEWRPIAPFITARLYDSTNVLASTLTVDVDVNSGVPGQIGICCYGSGAADEIQFSGSSTPA